MCRKLNYYNLFFHALSYISSFLNIRFGSESDDGHVIKTKLMRTFVSVPLCSYHFHLQKVKDQVIVSISVSDKHMVINSSHTAVCITRSKVNYPLTA